MTGFEFKKFIFDIENCSDKRLREIYLAVVDEMEERAWFKKEVADIAEAISEVESDWGHS